MKVVSHKATSQSTRVLPVTRLASSLLFLITLAMGFTACMGLGGSTKADGKECKEPAVKQGPWAPKPSERQRSELPTISVMGGTGRMGVHLCAAWANAGYDVTMCSRSKEKAQAIVDELLAGKGYEKKVTGAIAGQGDYCVPPTPADGWNLKAGDNAEASKADIIVLGTMYEQAWPLLEDIAPMIKGKGKTILDMTNPFLTRPDGYGAGLPKDGLQAGILIHKEKLNDPTVKWVGAYKHIMWTLILPSGPKNPKRPDIEVFGDEEAVDTVVELIYSHGWRPIVRGGLEVAPDYEGGVVSFGKIFRNLKREMRLGEKLSVGW